MPKLWILAIHQFTKALLSDFNVATGDFVADNIDAAAPPQVGRLDLICCLGSSRFGSVHIGEDSLLQKQVAVKYGQAIV